jgi:hypothetical protein
MQNEKKEKFSLFIYTVIAYSLYVYTKLSYYERIFTRKKEKHKVWMGTRKHREKL